MLGDIIVTYQAVGSATARSTSLIGQYISTEFAHSNQVKVIFDRSSSFILKTTDGISFTVHLSPSLPRRSRNLPWDLNLALLFPSFTVANCSFILVDQSTVSFTSVIWLMSNMYRSINHSHRHKMSKDNIIPHKMSHETIFFHQMCSPLGVTVTKEQTRQFDDNERRVARQVPVKASVLQTPILGLETKARFAMPKFIKSTIWENVNGEWVKNSSAKIRGRFDFTAIQAVFPARKRKTGVEDEEVAVCGELNFERPGTFKVQYTLMNLFGPDEDSTFLVPSELSVTTDEFTIIDEVSQCQYGPGVETAFEKHMHGDCGVKHMNRRKRARAKASTRTDPTVTLDNIANNRDIVAVPISETQAVAVRDARQLAIDQGVEAFNMMQNQSPTSFMMQDQQATGYMMPEQPTPNFTTSFHASTGSMLPYHPAVNPMMLQSPSQSQDHSIFNFPQPLHQSDYWHEVGEIAGYGAEQHYSFGMDGF